MNELFHRKCGQRQHLHFGLICRLSCKPRTSSSPYVLNESNLQLRGTTQKKQLILSFGSRSIVWTITSLFSSGWCFPMEHLFTHSFVENAIIRGTNLLQGLGLENDTILFWVCCHILPFLCSRHFYPMHWERCSLRIHEQLQKENTRFSQVVWWWLF